MKEQKAPLDLADVRQHIELLKQELAAYQTLEQSLMAIKIGEATLGLKGMFHNMSGHLRLPEAPSQAANQIRNHSGSH